MSDSSRQAISEMLPSDLVQGQLRRIVASQHFRNSRRCQALLAYVVERACEGRLDELKERVVGNRVFGRDADYDTNQDAVVRNAAAEVRKRLAQYYMVREHDGELRIELPPGSYVPEFNLPHPGTGPAVEPAPAAAPARPFRWGPAALGVGAVALTAMVAMVAVKSFWTPFTDLDRFWAPVVTAEGVVQICVGQSGKYYYREQVPVGPDNEIDTHAQVPTANLAPMRDRFIYFGDAISMAKLGGYLYSKGKTLQLRGAKTTPYSELRGKPVVLIGAFNNPWTIRLTEGLRFSLRGEAGNTTRMVFDRDHPGEQPWKIARPNPDWNGEEDYALVTRVFEPILERCVVAAGGITEYGTIAAGEFLSNPAYFQEAVGTAPSGWEKKNMQVVLQTKVVGGTPGPPRVLATHFW